MNFDPMYVFIFVRQDLFNWKQLVHVSHVAMEMGADMLRSMPLAELAIGTWKLNGYPNIIIAGAQNAGELHAIHENLVNLKNGTSCIITAHGLSVITRTRKVLGSNYKATCASYIFVITMLGGITT